MKAQNTSVPWFIQGFDLKRKPVASIKKAELHGTELHPDDQKYVISTYVHRFTKQHKPKWAAEYEPVQFASDQDWLEHTTFRVRKNGRLDLRVKDCYSSPTWPDNPELIGRRV